uniref:Uncharacterized protein n=1 Tax=Anguilla anguilla TaxID=7936 RepID=A0A0E9RR77_ANGAN
MVLWFKIHPPFLFIFGGGVCETTPTWFFCCCFL